MTGLDDMIKATGNRGKFSVQIFGDIICSSHGTYGDGVYDVNVNISGLWRKEIMYYPCAIVLVCPLDPMDYSARHRLVTLTNRTPGSPTEFIDSATPGALDLLRAHPPFSPRISAADLTRLFISDTSKYNEFKRTQEPLVVAAQAPVAPSAPSAPSAPRAPPTLQTPEDIDVPHIDILLSDSLKNATISVYRGSWNDVEFELHRALRLAYVENLWTVLDQFDAKVQTERPSREVPHVETPDGKYIVSGVVRNLDQLYKNGTKKLSYEHAEGLSDIIENVQKVVKGRKRDAEESRLLRKFSKS